MTKGIWLVVLVLLLAGGFFSPVLGGDLLFARSDDSFVYPPPLGEELEAKEREKQREEENKKPKPAKPAPPLLFPLGLRFSGIYDTLRGQAFDYRTNNYGYDQATKSGFGFEFEFSYRATKTWTIYGSADIVLFGASSDFVNHNDTSTDPNTVTFIPIEFKAWNHTNIFIGGKYYPFEEETGFVPYLKVGMGFTIQPDLKSTFQGVSETQIKGQAGPALELGAGMEYRMEWGSLRIGLVVEIMFLHLTKQKGGLLRGSNNMYAFPLKMGLVIYI